MFYDILFCNIDRHIVFCTPLTINTINSTLCCFTNSCYVIILCIRYSRWNYRPNVFYQNVQVICKFFFTCMILLYFRYQKLHIYNIKKFFSKISVSIVFKDCIILFYHFYVVLCIPIHILVYICISA